MNHTVDTASRAKKPLDVHVVGASRWPSVRYVPESRDHMTLSGLLGKTVAKLPLELRLKVDTVYIVHHYEAPYSRAEFFKEAGFSGYLAHQVFYPADLGGLDAVNHAVETLRGTRTGTILVAGGEVMESAHSNVASPEVEQYSQEENSVALAPDLDNLLRRRAWLARESGLADQDISIGLTPLSANALAADAFFRSQDLSLAKIEDLMCRLSCHLEMFARLNPNAYQFHRLKPNREMIPITPNAYKNRVKQDGRGKKWPFHEWDCCPISNGAAAVVISNDPSLVQHTPSIRVASALLRTEDGRRSLLNRPHLEANQALWRDLRNLTGLELASNSQADSDERIVLELMDSYAYQIAAALIDIGLFKSVDDILAAFDTGYFNPVDGEPKSNRSRGYLIDSVKAGEGGKGRSEDVTVHGGIL